MNVYREILNLIDEESQNITSNNYFKICNKLKESYEIIEPIINQKIEEYECIIQLLSHSSKSITLEEKGLIIKEFCEQHKFEYKVKMNEASIKNFKYNFLKRFNFIGSTTKKLIKDEFKDFYETKKQAILNKKQELINEYFEEMMKLKSFT